MMRNYINLFPLFEFFKLHKTHTLTHTHEEEIYLGAVETSIKERYYNNKMSFEDKT